MADALKGTSVFVNCPFDPRYRRLFDSLIFAVTACGYRVRSALEIEDSGDLRSRKIVALIEQWRLSIHDISRVTLDPATKLPRFNMPIELGIAPGMKYLGRKALREHKMPEMASAAKQTVSKLGYTDRLRHVNAFLGSGT